MNHMKIENSHKRRGKIMKVLMALIILIPAFLFISCRDPKIEYKRFPTTVKTSQTEGDRVRWEEDLDWSKPSNLGFEPPRKSVSPQRSFKPWLGSDQKLGLDHISKSARH